MLYFGDREAVWSQAKIPALTNATIYIDMYWVTKHASEGYSHLWTLGCTSLPEWHLQAYTDGSGNTYLRLCSIYSVPTGGSPDVWQCAVDLNKYYCIGVKWNFGTSSSTTPTIYLNGVKQTLTHVTTGDSMSAMGSDYVAVGGSYLYNVTAGTPGTINYELDSIGTLTELAGTPFQGYLSEFAIDDRQHTDAEMEAMTKSMVKRWAHLCNIANVLYCPLDEHMKDADINMSPMDMLPNEDVTTEWTNKTQSTYYDSINEDNGTDYIEATSSDDGKTMQFGLTSITLPTNAEVYGMNLRIHAQGLSATGLVPTVSLIQGGTQLPTFSGTWRWNFDSMAYGDISWWGSWTQAEIDSMNLRIVAPGSIAKNTSFRIYYARVRCYYNIKKCRDWSGNGVHFRGKTALGGVERRAYPA